MKLQRSTNASLLLAFIVLSTAVFGCRSCWRQESSKRIVGNPYSNPIGLAVFYDSSPERFEEIVKNNVDWININDVDPDGTIARTILGRCALAGSTNRVRTLIVHGADCEAAISTLNLGTKRDIDAIRLIQEAQESCQSEPRND